MKSPGCLKGSRGLQFAVEKGNSVFHLPRQETCHSLAQLDLCFAWPGGALGLDKNHCAGNIAF